MRVLERNGESCEESFGHLLGWCNVASIYMNLDLRK
jgi:hypothetical protein